MIIQSKLPVKFEFEPWIETASATPDMFGYGPDEQLLVVCEVDPNDPKNCGSSEILTMGVYIPAFQNWAVYGLVRAEYKVTCWKPAPTLPSEGGPVWQALN